MEKENVGFMKMDFWTVLAMLGISGIQYVPLCLVYFTIHISEDNIEGYIKKPYSICIIFFLIKCSDDVFNFCRKATTQTDFKMHTTHTIRDGMLTNAE